MQHDFQNILTNYNILYYDILNIRVRYFKRFLFLQKLFEEKGKL